MAILPEPLPIGFGLAGGVMFGANTTDSSGTSIYLQVCIEFFYEWLKRRFRSQQALTNHPKIHYTSI